MNIQEDLIKALRCLASCDGLGNCYENHYNITHNGPIMSCMGLYGDIPCPFYQSTYPTCFEDGECGQWLNTVADILENNKKVNDNWVSMENGFPDEVNRYYSVTYQKVLNGQNQYFSSASYLGTFSDGSKKWEIEENFPYIKVVAWMEFPDPYQPIEDLKHENK